MKYNWFVQILFYLITYYFLWKTTIINDIGNWNSKNYSYKFDSLSIEKEMVPNIWSSQKKFYNYFLFNELNLILN